MRSKRCETCRHFQRHPWKTDDQHSAGTCRVRSVSGFPARYADDWCGEWACAVDIDDMPEAETADLELSYVDIEDRIGLSEKIRLIRESAPIVVQAPKWSAVDAPKQNNERT